jgi:NFU1 iron-sulfur cluster scaffold homolog, mitochondrial
MNPSAGNLIMIYTEATPNPETLKFVANKLLINFSMDFPDEKSAEDSPLAKELFGFPFVRGVFIASNFVTVTKTADVDWIDIKDSLKEFIKEYIVAGKPVMHTEKIEVETENTPEDNGASSETDKKIMAILDKYIKPAVEMDGGAIIFKSYDAGKVTLALQGSCSGCPSATVTLKSGIEGLLKQMMPNEIKEVVAEMM